MVGFKSVPVWVLSVGWEDMIHMSGDSVMMVERGLRVYFAFLGTATGDDGWMSWHILVY